MFFYLYKNLFFLLFGIAIIFSIIASRWVKVENDLKAYLPDSAETTVGLKLMGEQFVTYGTADVNCAWWWLRSPERRGLPCWG